LIADSGEINPFGQVRAAGSALTFALSQTRLNVSPLVVASFPIVYRELKQDKQEPSILSIFFPDWDRCKAIRKGDDEEFPPIELASVRPAQGVTTHWCFGAHSQYPLKRGRRYKVSEAA
jgi:hypothetical protein